MTRRWIAAAGLVAAACGSRTPMTPTPTATAPQITCPSDVRVTGAPGQGQPVTFSAPTVTDGTAPVTSTCTRASGDVFPLGTTSVSCTARDAASRQAVCSFNVTVTGLALAAVKFEAFGDSLTQGENGLPVTTFVDPPNSYPTKLLALLASTFPGQGITVVNQGVGGELIEKTRDTIPNALLRDRPQAVLLLGGYNDLTTPCGPGVATSVACGNATEKVSLGVRDCIRKAKESPVGVKYIFVSTLTPPGTGPKRIDRDAIIEVNRKIRLMAASERATLVDSYPAFLGHEAEYVSIDGLHLRPAGYQALADAFFAAIKATIPQTPLFSNEGGRE